MLSNDKCKLCHNVRPLLKKSHIIPEFMYDVLFDGHHKLNLLAPAKYVKGNRRIGRPSSGVYEGGLLCQKCEAEVIGPYETYARSAIYGGRLPPNESPICQNIITPEGVKFTRCTNTSYKKFKLFLLSILWRASISRNNFFKEVDLGPHEEIIRQMILSGDPKEPDDYPIILFTYLNDVSVPVDLIGQPGMGRMADGFSYNFTICGITYVYFSKHSIPPKLLPYTLLSSDELTLFHIPEGRAWKLLQTYFGINI